MVVPSRTQMASEMLITHMYIQILGVIEIFGTESTQLHKQQLIFYYKAKHKKVKGAENINIYLVTSSNFFINQEIFLSFLSTILLWNRVDACLHMCLQLIWRHKAHLTRKERTVLIAQMTKFHIMFLFNMSMKCFVTSTTSLTLRTSNG
jgi:hypothetical protein